jgi:hypothetical protein
MSNPLHWCHFPKFVLHLEPRTFRELRKVMGTGKSMTLVLSDIVGLNIGRNRTGGHPWYDAWPCFWRSRWR